LIEFDGFQKLLFGHALLKRVRHVDRARPDQQGPAPRAAERRVRPAGSTYANDNAGIKRDLRDRVRLIRCSMTRSVASPGDN